MYLAAGRGDQAREGAGELLVQMPPQLSVPADGPARLSARDAAASCVTTSAQSRPSSIILITPPIWP